MGEKDDFGECNGCDPSIQCEVPSDTYTGAMMLHKRLNALGDPATPTSS
jgi:hypothetical protein